jgi:membrane fusion protein (multidrug efflux system)
MSAVSSGYVPTRADDEARAESRRRLLRRVLMIGGVALFAIVAAAVYLWGGRYIGGDDAYVHANKLMVSTDVSGLVATVDVKEGQKVRAGDILFTLDPKPFRIALDNARAALAGVEQDVESTRAQYRAAVAQIAAQQAQVNVNRQTLAKTPSRPSRSIRPAPPCCRRRRRWRPCSRPRPPPWPSWAAM